jgi:hypothetical protein
MTADVPINAPRPCLQARFKVEKEGYELAEVDGVDVVVGVVGDAS